MIRQIVFYGSYFKDFFDAQTEKVKEKIDYVLYLVANIEQVPVKYLKKLENTDGLYEVRVRSGNNIFRIFCCFDQGKLVVLLNGFQKKTQKTPKNELAKAANLKKEYFEYKKKQKGGK